MSPVSWDDPTQIVHVDAVLGRGRHVGPYSLLSELGRGGMGIVYRAWHETLKRHCAVKVLGGMPSVRLRERFVLEGQAAARLGKHPHIVQVFDAGEADDTAYIAMELVDGTPLDALLAERGRIPEAEAIAIGRKVAMALGHAHQCGIVHRDMKPGNVIVDRDGEPLILDFGLAKDLGVADSALSVAGNIIGTPNYMPPEQADASRGSVDPRSDVYSLGATLYHALGGEMPFQAPRVVDTIVQVLSRQPPRLRPAAPVSRDLEAVVLRAMEKRSRDRYQTALEMADDLARVAAGDAPKARAVGPVGRAWRRVRRRPGLVAAALLLVLAAVAATAWVVLQRNEADRLWRQAYDRVAHATASEAGRLLEPAFPLVREMGALASAGLLSVGDPDTLARELAPRIVYRGRLSWLSYSDASGRFTGATRPEGKQHVLINRSWLDADGVGHLKEERFLEHGEQEVLREVTPWDYDPRTKPFYAAAAASDEPIWVGPYPFNAGEGYGITLAYALRDHAGVRGVFTADYRLEAISRFLAGLDLGEGGRALLLAGDGTIIARSDGAAGAAEDPVAARALTLVDLASLTPGSARAVEVEGAAGVVDVVALERFVVEGGLSWTSMVIVPRATIRGDVDRVAGLLGLLGLALIGALLLITGFFVVRRRITAKQRQARAKRRYSGV